ncbi:MAG TPA: 2-phosphosulfolactate phosphatase [Bryobacteraceae bacterium]|nr:2-phosphosulfolactate phosphatase [Bryobacteraceae bacterium]
MQKLVVIDYLPENVSRYRPDWAIVAVDVIRATTTAITAAANGWRCFPVPTVEAALGLAKQFENPLLAGESGGKMPAAFEMDNSPAEVVSRSDIYRPLVLVSSTGTKVIHEAVGCEATYLSCFRSYSVLADYLAKHHQRIAIIGAGSLGEFREEDQACCAWIAAGLMTHGYLAKNPETKALVRRWYGEPPEACLGSRSVTFLKHTDRLKDLDFIFDHIDDLRSVFAVQDGEVRLVHEAEPVGCPAGVQAGRGIMR